MSEETTRQRSSEPAKGPPSQEQLRQFCWDLGARFGGPFSGDHLAFAPVHPRLTYLHWHVREASVESLKQRVGHPFDGAALVVRVYDVTDVEFDGLNAHRFFDLDIDRLHGNYYLGIDQLERNLLAEVGFRLRDSAFHALARSNTIFCDRERPSSTFQLSGLYVGRDFKRVFAVDNVADAPVYERLNCELADFGRQRPIAVASIHLDIDLPSQHGGQLPGLLDCIIERCARFDLRVDVLGRSVEPAGQVDRSNVVDVAEAHAARLWPELKERHQQRPFELLHCHDWQSIPAGLQAGEALKLPLVLSLHSTEHDRSRGDQRQAEAIREWERRGVAAASMVLVPHSSTRQQVITLYGANEQRVLIVPDVFQEQPAALPDPSGARRGLDLNPDWPVVLFASEVSHATGADILMDALINVCGENGQVQFVFAGEGPLKGELEGRAWHAGLGHRVRFLGDVSAEWFESVLLACDFVVIPARTWHDEGLAQMALSCGKPVLTTHQSQIRCVQHGENGLMTYDNPGSIVWGVKELLANPLHGNMLRVLAKHKGDDMRSLESTVAEYYLAYERTLNAVNDQREKREAKSDG